VAKKADSKFRHCQRRGQDLEFGSHQKRRTVSSAGFLLKSSKNPFFRGRGNVSEIGIYVETKGAHFDKM
jgi:hypothetical protein